MKSYILNSNACRHCESASIAANDRRTLRTSTKDICTRCGAVVQDFSDTPIQFGKPKDGQIGFPQEVSDLLEKLSRRRLFSVSNAGTNPGLMPTHVDESRDHAQQQRLIRRAGGTAYINMDGTGNCSAELRWSYELESPAHKHRKYADLTGVSAGIYSTSQLTHPTRIRRTCDLLQTHSFNFTGLHFWSNHRGRELRFEALLPVENQPLETGKLILVVTMALSWLQIGTSHPREDTPRIYSMKQTTRPQQKGLTITEAVDRAIDEIFSERNTTVPVSVHGEDGSSVCIFSTALNDLRWPRQDPNYWTKVFLKQAAPGQYDPPREGNFIEEFPVHNKEGQQIVPAGVKLKFEFSGGGDRAFELRWDDELIDSGPLPKHSWLPLEKYRDSKPGLDLSKPGLLRLTIHGERTPQVLEYKVVHQKEYWRCYHACIDPKLERIKHNLIAEAQKRANTNQELVFVTGEKVAAHHPVYGWLEATYEGRTGDNHHVNFDSTSGAEYLPTHNSQIMKLGDALEMGLEVRPPASEACQLMHAANGVIGQEVI